MNVAVIIEESYTLYGEYNDRTVEGVIIQRKDESEDVFIARVDKHVSALKSRYSWYRSEFHSAED